MRARTNRTNVSMAVIVGLLAAWTSETPTFAVDIIDDPVQIDERATQVIQTTNLLCWEMHQFHQQQSDYPESYRIAKGIWSQAGQLQEALRVGPVETEVLVGQVTELNAAFSQLERSLSKWESGDRSLVATNGGPSQRTIVRPGVEVDIPFVGFRVGRPPIVVTEDGPPQLERKRLHPNSRGSKRSLERDMTAVKLALSYLSEDVGVTLSPNSQPTLAPLKAVPAPQPQLLDSKLGDPETIVPPRAKSPKVGSIP